MKYNNLDDLLYAYLAFHYVNVSKNSFIMNDFKIQNKNVTCFYFHWYDGTQMVHWHMRDGDFYNIATTLSIPLDDVNRIMYNYTQPQPKWSNDNKTAVKFALEDLYAKII